MTNRVRLLLVLLLVTGILAFGGMIFAAGGYDIPWHVIGGGGGTSSGGHYTVDATIGQPVAATSSGGHYQVCAGYWCGNVPGWHLYLPKVLKAHR